MIDPVLPGSTIGIIGGGQLGRMLAQSAQAMGYLVYVLDPDPDAPACQITDHRIIGRYEDPRAIALLRQSCDAITYEFENVQPEPLQLLREEGYHLHPNPQALFIARNRSREKRFAQSCGLACAPYRDGLVLNGTETDRDVAIAAGEMGDCIVKSEEGGYDGKGQIRLSAALSPEERLQLLGEFRRSVITDGLKACRGEELPVVVEGLVAFESEFSMIVARFADGSFRAFPPLENRHRRGILHRTTSPMGLPEAALDACRESLRIMVEKLDYFGVLAVEFFSAHDGRIIFNEMAPRPHNSGHLTIEACGASQFEQHIRSVCGLPPGETSLRRPAGMLNLVTPTVPLKQYALSILSKPEVHLHLYGKKEERPGRKMGHITVLGETLHEVNETLDTLEGILI